MFNSPMYFHLRVMSYQMCVKMFIKFVPFGLCQKVTIFTIPVFLKRNFAQCYNKNNFLECCVCVMLCHKCCLVTSSKKCSLRLSKCNICHMRNICMNVPTKQVPKFVQTKWYLVCSIPRNRASTYQLCRGVSQKLLRLTR